jgi:parallel beta-helix repeat protein
MPLHQIPNREGEMDRRDFLCRIGVGGVALNLPPEELRSEEGAPSPRTYVVSGQDPRADDSGPGTAQRPFRTISRAAALAQPGDTVLVHEGVYREWVIPPRGGEPNKPITYLAAPKEQVVVKGSEVWKPQWKKLADHEGVYFARLDETMFGEYNPYRLHWLRRGPARPSTGPRMPRTLGQIFLDARPLNEVETLEDVYLEPGTWIVSAEGDGIYVHLPCDTARPDQYRVEISVRGRIFAPQILGLGYIHVKGFVFEHCANQIPWPEHAAVSTRSGNHWIIEDNVVRYAKSTGLWAGSDAPETDVPELRGKQPPPDVVGYHLVRHNLVTDNGETGIMGILQTGTRVIENVVERNNFLGVHPGEEAGKYAGIKFLNFYDGLIEGNLIRDNDFYGIWLDRAWDGSRITRNLIINNLDAGIYIELGHGPVMIDNNVIAYTRAGDGIRTGDSSRVSIAHNLIYGNAGFGVWMWVETDRHIWGKDRPSAIVEASYERVVNNMILGNYCGAVCLPFPWSRAHDNHSDYNLMNLPGLHVPGPRLGMAPRFAYNDSRGHIQAEEVYAKLKEALGAGAPPSDLPYLSLEQWRAVSGDDEHSLAMKLNRPMFRSRILDFELEADDTPWKLACPPIAGMGRDLLGNPMPAQGTVLPGPFQNLKPGRNRFSLWPLPKQGCP